MPTPTKKLSAVVAVPDLEPQAQGQAWPSRLLGHVPNPFPVLEPLLKRDEADILFVAGNLALVALEVIEWPVVVLTLTLHAMARSRSKVLEVVAEVAEEAE